MALVRAIFGQNPEDMAFNHFAKMAGEAVYLKNLEFKIMRNAVQSAVSKLFEKQ